MEHISSPTAGTLDQYIEAIPDRQGWQHLASEAGWGEPLPGMPDPVVADADGRFEITGIGAERACAMLVAGPGIDDAQITVMTRGTEPVKPYVRGGIYGTPVARPPEYPLYGATFEHVGSPARTVRGVVRNRHTGQPVRGVSVRCSFKRGDSVQETDEQGRFEFSGVPRLPRYYVHVRPRVPYFANQVRIEDTPGIEPIEVTVDLARGMVAAGRVTDGETGEPVQGTVEYNALYPNEHVDRLGHDVARPCSSAEVGPDGSYALAVLPGPGVLAFRVSHELGDRQYMSALVDTEDLQKLLGDVKIRGPHDDFLQTAVGGTRRSVMGQRGYQCLELISPDTQSAVLTVDLACQRGRSLTGSVVGPDGKPIQGATVTGLDAPNVFRETTLHTDQFTVRGLNPGRTRSLMFYHAERQVGTGFELAGDRQGPLVVRLQPCGTVVGRATDKDGQPVAGEMVVVNRERFISPDSPWTDKTDAEGRFRIDGLVPSQGYHVRLRDQGFSVNFKLTPGQTKDLGAKQLKR
jgi:hypothetical protein